MEKSVRRHVVEIHINHQEALFERTAESGTRLIKSGRKLHTPLVEGRCMSLIAARSMIREHEFQEWVI